MAITFNSTTPAAPAGSKNIAWQKDGSGNLSGNLDATFAVPVFNPGVGSNSQVLLVVSMPVAVTFPSGAGNSVSKAKTAATGSTTFTLKQNGSSFATVVYSASGTTGAWTQASDATFSVGDILEIDGPATADATLANFFINLVGYKS